MMLQYAENTSCRRKFILNYFGESYDEARCGTCDNCRHAAASPARPVGEEARTGTFKISDVVVHPKFGTGSIERAERDLVTVLFPSLGYKTLLASAVRPLETELAATS